MPPAYALSQSIRCQWAPSSATHTSNGNGLQTEIAASFPWTVDNHEGQFGVSILNGTAKLIVDCSKYDQDGCCSVNAGRIGPHRNQSGESPPCLFAAPFACDSGPLFPLKTKSVHLHAIIDGRIIETIWNSLGDLIRSGLRDR